MRSKLKWILIVGISLMSLLNAWVHSPTVDEVAHLSAGVSHWRFGNLELYAVNPPLMRLVAALPVMAVDHEEDWSAAFLGPALRSEFPTGRLFISQNGVRSITLFRYGRLVCTIFLIILVNGVWRGMRTVYPEMPLGRIGAVLVIHPAVLAFGSAVIPDIAAAAAGIWALLSILEYFDKPKLASAFLAGAMIGISILCKFTWLPVFPLVIWFRILIGRGTGDQFRHVRNLAIIGFSAFILVNVGYGFDRTWTKLGKIKLVSASFASPEGANAGSLNRFSHTLTGEIPVPLPLPLIQGIDVQKSDFEQGFRSYLMGKWKHGGWWYYYLVGFLVKEPIGFQLMLYVSILHGVWNWKRWTKVSVREWSLIVLPPLLIFGLVSSQTGFNHHMRYVLPAYPFLFIIAARTVTLGKFWKWFSYACLTWQAAAVLWFAPHWMSYFNEFAGGPTNGHKWLVDSNIDWGQDILGLKWWQDKHPEATPLHAAMFTGFDPKDIGLKFNLPAPFVRGRPDIVSKDGLRGPQPGWYAVSVCMLKGLHFSVPEGNGEWSWSTENFTYFLDNFEPVDMIGYSIYIYHISEDDASRVQGKLLAEEAEFLQGASGPPKAAGDPK